MDGVMDGQMDKHTDGWTINVADDMNRLTCSLLTFLCCLVSTFTNGQTDGRADGRITNVKDSNSCDLLLLLLKGEWEHV